MSIDEQAVAELCAKYEVRVLRVFGSVARGEDSEESDLDLLVEFAGEKSLFDLIGLQLDLEERLGRKVDLATPSSISPYIREQVFQEARVLYESAA